MSFTILIAEDDSDSREALALLMRLEGFNVITAPDGSKALELAVIYNPHLIITDICMPGLTGIELTQKICSRPNNRIPVIAITAAPDLVQQNVIKEGAVDCLTKPIDLNKLLCLTNSLLVDVPIAKIA